MSMRSAANYEFNGCYIPERMAGSLRLWIERGIAPGSFLMAVLENNLSEAVGRADDENLANLPAYVGYLYNEAPAPCWGSPAKCEAWAKEMRLQLAA
jgi:hypothetical protein